MNRTILVLILFTSLCFGSGISFNGGGNFVVPPTITSVSSNISLVNNTINYVDTTSARTLTMPAPTSGRVLWIKDASWLAGTNNITLLRSASEKLEGISQSYVYQINGGAMEWRANGTDWFLF